MNDQWEWVRDESEPEFDMTPFKIEKGEHMPLWFWNALADKRIVPQPEPMVGDFDWIGDGILVKKTGEFFPNGSVILKGDLNFRSI